jgi:CheY-like chemotaxis protein
MHLPEEPLMVKADIAQIEQVIIHLAANACEAMSAGGQLTIAGSCVRLSKDEIVQLNREGENVADGEFAVLSVSDNGTGMTDEVKSRIFEPFFTTKKEKKGTGLGLSTVYGIVRQHDGCMTVYSKPGDGTTFEVYLPLRNNDAVQSNGQTEFACGDETVLFVDEDSIMRMVGGKILRELGYSVLETTSGKQAIDVCQKHEHPIHFMITDLFMSDMAGKDLAGIIRKKVPEMRVLFTSGYPKVHLVERAVVTMEDAVICRPFSKSALASAIRNVLQA